MTDYWLNYRASMSSSLERVSVTSVDGKEVQGDQSLAALCAWSHSVREEDRLMHFVGNGASACMASHMAVDWVKNAGVKAMAYNDISFLTAIGNDLGYEQIFAQPLGWFGKKGDLLATISSSGNSPNVLKAIATARQAGMRVVTLSGMKPDNASRKLGDLNFYVPAWTYGIVECAHQVLLHAWLDHFMKVKSWELSGPQVVLPVR